MFEKRVKVLLKKQNKSKLMLTKFKEKVVISVPSLNLQF